MDELSQCCGVYTHELGDFNICSSCKEWCEIYREGEDDDTSK
jgi:hypothetical protein